MSNDGQSSFEDDEIDLFELLQTLLARWQLIIGASLGAAVLAAGGWLALKPYQSSVLITDHAVDEAQPGGYLDFLKWREAAPLLVAKAQQALAAQPDSNSAIANSLLGLATTKAFEQAVQPSYAEDKASIKALGNVEGVSAGDILALRIEGASRDPKELTDSLVQQAQFIKAGLVDDALVRWLNKLEISIERDASRVREQVAVYRVALRLVDERLALLKQRVGTQQGSVKVDLTQVLDPKGDNAKFLPAAVQIAALESDALLTRSKIRDAQEQMQAIELRRALVESAQRKGASANATVDELLQRARQLEAQAPAEQYLYVQEAARLVGALTNLANLNRVGLVIQAPSEPSRDKFALTVILAAVAAGFLSVIWVMVANAFRKRREGLISVESMSI